MSEFKFELGERVRHIADAGTWRIGGCGVVTSRGMVENIEHPLLIPMYTVSFPDRRCWYIEAELAKAEVEK